MRLLTYSLLILCSFLLSAQKFEEPVYTASGLAIQGYDPVAYFTDAKPVKGIQEFSMEWQGSIWLFANADNLKAFKENPTKYAPQYGGYCAWGMSKGYKAKIDPENAWTIHEGKLYLNYNKGIKSKWTPKKEELIKEADENWKKF